MKNFFLLFVWLVFSLINANAQSLNPQHTIQRGETIESIAKKYNVDPKEIIAANPTIKDMFYAGMIIVIPERQEDPSREVLQTTAQNNPQVPNNKVNDINYIEEVGTITPADFSAVWISYEAPFDLFKYGYYGIGFSTYSPSGFMGSFSVHGNFGLVEDGNLKFKFGPGYGKVLHPNIMMSASLLGFTETYDAINEKGSKTQKITGGIVVQPAITFRAEKFTLTFGYDLGWCKGYSDLYHNAVFRLGYNF